MANDHGLTPEQLADKYAPDGGGQHHKYPLRNWRREVWEGDTLRGYWEWVRAQIEEADHG